MNGVDYAAPAGRLILPVSAPREEWLTTRLQGIGGSDVAAIMGLSSYTSAYDVWSSKVDPRTDDASSEAMWWGQQTEALTVQRFEQETGLATRRAGTYAHRDHSHHMVNPDRFVEDGGVLEVKDHEAMSDAGKTVLRGGITEAAYAQLQWAIHVTGRSHGWFVAKVGKRAMVRGPFPRDDAFITEAIAAADVLWQYVVARTAPPVDLATVRPEEVADRFPVVTPGEAFEVTSLAIPDMALDDIARLQEIRVTGEAFAAEREQIETRLKALIGDREYLTVDGRPVFRWQQVAGRKAFDKDAAVRRLAELTGKTPVEVEQELTKQGAPSRRFSPVETKEKAA